MMSLSRRYNEIPQLTALSRLSHTEQHLSDVRPGTTLISLEKVYNSKTLLEPYIGFKYLIISDTLRVGVLYFVRTLSVILTLFSCRNNTKCQ